MLRKPVHNIKAIMSNLGFNLQNATITIERNESEGGIEIRLRDMEISTSEYSTYITVDGVHYDWDEPYKTLLSIVKQNT